MDTDWRDLYFDEKLCKGKISNNNNNKDTNITITGTIKNIENVSKLTYWAASPPHTNYSFSGSGIPFSNPEQAFDRSPNVGFVDVIDGKFTIKLIYPSAYYIGLGTKYVPPQVHLKICGRKGFDTIVLGTGMPYRTLNHPAPPTKNIRNGPEFYTSNLPLPIRSQETILRQSAYPKKYYMDDNFWGMKPAN